MCDQVLSIGNHDLRGARINAFARLSLQLVDKRLVIVSGRFAIPARASTGGCIQLDGQRIRHTLVFDLAGSEELRHVILYAVRRYDYRERHGL